MDVNSDFSQRVLVRTGELEWLPSPMQGVDRRMLDRIGDEVARATSIVRYAKGSAFPEHTHGGGEEFIVLDGTFQDEHGDYPAGTYVRNPPTTHHIPRSDPGCTIFVKLWQFDKGDRNQFSLDLNEIELSPVDGWPGVREAVIHRDEREVVRLAAWDPDSERAMSFPGGGEILVLSGSLDTPEGTMQRHDWMRLPDGDAVRLKAGPEGVRFWTKRGHLTHIRVPQA